MARIKIEDLRKDMEISREDMRRLYGGKCDPPNKYVRFIPVPSPNAGSGAGGSSGESSGNSVFRTSTGDESGTMGGVVSSQNTDSSSGKYPELNSAL